MRHLYNAIYEKLHSSPTFQKILAETFKTDHDAALAQLSFTTAGEVSAFVAACDSVECRDVLEIGCGYGGLAIRLIETLSVDLLAIDISEVAIATARERAGASALSGKSIGAARFEIVDIDDFELPPASLDAIVSIDALQHSRDRIACVGKLASMLRPGGILMFTTWFDHAPHAVACDLVSTHPYFKLMAECGLVANAVDIDDPGLRRQFALYKRVYEQRDSLVAEVGSELVEMLLREALFLGKGSFSRCRVLARKTKAARAR